MGTIFLIHTSEKYTLYGLTAENCCLSVRGWRMIDDKVFAKLAKEVIQVFDSSVLEQQCIQKLQNSAPTGL